MLGYQGSAYLASGKVPGLQGRTHDSYALAYCVTARDGVDVMIAANAQRSFEELAKTVGRPELISDPRFLTGPDRNRNKVVLRAILDEACLQVDSKDITAALHRVGAPAAVINSIDRALAEPQVLHREMVLAMQGGQDADRVRVPGDPIKLTEAPRDKYRYPPHAGEHSHSVLRELLGYDDAQIAQLAGVVLERPVSEKTQEF